MDMKSIGIRIAALRKGLGYTQESLAEKLGVSPQAVSKWETGAGLPEVSLIVELSKLFRLSVDEILRPDTPYNTISGFMGRNLAVPESKVLSWIPRISRWSPPAGCDMWYSFPAAIAEALVCVEAQEENRTDVTYAELNERFRDLMHITGLGYGFLWNTAKRHLIEELWHVNSISEMAARVMGYYGRDYLWLTPDNATADEARRIIMWSIAQGRPVVMEWPGGIPEFNVVAGYEDNGETLAGYTYCEECAAKTNEYGMFVNPARWGEPWGNGGFRILIIGDKVQPGIADSDSIEYALTVLDRDEAGDKEFFLSHEFIAGEPAMHAWLEACDTAEHTIELFTKPDLYTHALYMNTIYAQNCILPYYKKLGARNGRRVNDIVIQIDIALGRITNERHSLNSFKEKDEKFAAACRTHIENLIRHREFMRGWLRELITALDCQKAQG